jgi:hypothetical protein
MKDRNIRSSAYRRHVWGAVDELIVKCVRDGRSWRVAPATGPLWQRLFLFTDKTGWSSTWCDIPPGAVLVAGEVEL